MKYIAGILSPADYIIAALSVLVVTLVGMFSPKLNQLLFGLVAESGDAKLLTSIAVFMVCVTISSLLCGGVKELIMARISTKLNVTVQAASMARLMSLPAEFFKDYSSGELSTRAQYFNVLCTLLVDSLLSTGLTLLFSLIYISQIFSFAPSLVVPAALVILATLVFSVISTFFQIGISRRRMEMESKESGLSYALITGVQKIKLTGAEKRAFSKWGKLYAEYTTASYDDPTILRYNKVFTILITLAGTFSMYFIAAKSGVSVADYYAFDTAYGMVSGAFMSLAGITLTVADIKTIIEMVKPIMDAVPEIAEGKRVVTRLSGGVELNNVSFRYGENMPNVIDDLSLKIRAGQYVAIVGETGCGKSTLMRIMLGFETPQKGAVYYDGRDLNTIDLKSLRRRIGVVMQNGSLFQGDIYSNIVISAPWLSVDDAWEAAELAGIADDIKRATECTDLEAAELAEDMREYVLDIGKNFTFETVMSTDRNIKLLRRAKEKGYFVRCIYVLTSDVNINVHRVMRRFASGGHNVPVEKIKSRYERALGLIPELSEVCDIMHIYDNTDMPFRIFKKRKDQYFYWENSFWKKQDIERLTGHVFE